jgi:hypothetical protein
MELHHLQVQKRKRDTSPPAIILKKGASPTAIIVKKGASTTAIKVKNGASPPAIIDIVKRMELHHLLL